jgi:uncharacterized protein YjcR
MALDWDSIRREYEQTPISLNELAEKYGIKYPTIKSRKQRQGWTKSSPLDASQEKKDASINTEDASSKSEDASRRRRGAPKANTNAAGNIGGPGAPKGNKYAAGNRGGHGGPLGNKKAVTTGEFETIWFDTLTPEEQQLFGKVNTSPLAQAEESIIFLTFRERRMMERIAKLMAGLTEKELRVLSELRDEKELVKIYDPKTDAPKHIWIKMPKMMITEISETTVRLIDDILKVEDALTRVQQQKARFIALKHDIEQEKAKGGGVADAIAQHNERIQTLASLLQNPVPNRNINSFEDEAIEKKKA